MQQDKNLAVPTVKSQWEAMLKKANKELEALRKALADKENQIILIQNIIEDC